MNQCRAEHQVGVPKEASPPSIYYDDAEICYCQLPAGHIGLHIDYRGRTFTRIFSWPREARKAA